MNKVVIEVYQIGLILLGIGHFSSKLFHKIHKKLFKQNPAIDGLEATDQISNIGSTGHVINEQFVPTKFG